MSRARSVRPLSRAGGPGHEASSPPLLGHAHPELREKQLTPEVNVEKNDRQLFHLLLVSR